jgi:two-component system response regulator QseB
MRILLVEDDPLIGSGIEAGFSQAAFNVDWAKDGREATLALATTPYSLIILDLGLPKISGTEILKAIRQSRNDIPVLILTARDTPIERVAGLNNGADDYLGKPFDLHELVARCRALLRRAQGRSSEQIAYGDLLVDTAAHTITQDGESVSLGPREFALLARLLTHQGIPQSRERLEESLYGWKDGVESNAIEVHIYNLRKKLGADLIKNVRSIGYVVEKKP